MTFSPGQVAADRVGLHNAAPATAPPLAAATAAIQTETVHVPLTDCFMLDDRRRSFRVTGRQARLLLAILLPVLLLGLPAAPALGQDGIPTPADAAGEDVESIPGSAWLLPFESMRQGEPITWSIVIASVVAVTLIIQGFLRVRRTVILPDESNEQIEQLIAQRQYKELVEFTGNDDSFVSRSLHPALKRAPNIAEMKEALEAAVAEETSEQFRRLDYINVLANVGPLLGLLGTVVGIMDAFLAMRRAGGAAEVSALAEGISTALGTTMLGLILAVPCLIAYSILRNKADRLTQEGAELSEELLLSMRADGRPASAPPAGQAAARPAAQARPQPAQAGPLPAQGPVPSQGAVQ
jgi:biopolymer transport protein ExbB